MKKKILGGIAVLAIAAIAVFNVNMNLSVNNEEVPSLSLANVVALAGENNPNKKCKQESTRALSKELCSTYPVKYRIQDGTIYSFKKDENGTQTKGKRGFEGTIWNDCASHPNDRTVKYTASIVDC